MAILNFNKKFAAKVRNGKKKQTIRAFRKYPIRSGDKLHLYTGLRSKAASKLREVICYSVSIIQISEEGILFNSSLDRPPYYTASSINQLNEFARADGFKDWEEMKAWWLNVHGLPFTGNLIQW